MRAAAVAAARELERRHPDLITAKWWKEERGTRVFVDFNQNAPHKTVFGAWCARPRTGAQVSTPLEWDDVDAVDQRRADGAHRAGPPGRAGRRLGRDDRRPADLEPLLEMSARDMEAGLMDAPWPPVYPKLPDEPPRVNPSRARPVEAEPEGPG